MQSRPRQKDWQELLWSFAKHRVLTCASRTGLLEMMNGRFIDPDTAARELRLEPVAVSKTLRALAELGVAHRDEEGRYRLASDFVAVFGSGKEAAPFLEHSHHLYDSWGENLESFLRGGPWARFSRDTEGIRQFAEAMRSMARVVAPQVAEALDLVGVRRVIDFGGGVGEYARVLCRASADVHVTVVETPTVAAFGTADLESEFRGRIEFFGGDYIEADCGAGYDLALLANVVHQENEERASRLISQAAKVLGPGGRLAIVDFALSEDGGSELGALFSLNMRGFGDVYDARRLSHWMRGASLSHIQKTSLGPHRMMLVGHKLR
jgi:SAM-dependent methyltransferase